MHTLIASVPPSGATIELDFAAFMSDFEMVVCIAPPPQPTHLGATVTAALKSPMPLGSGPANFWQNVLFSFFVTPLQNNQVNTAGVVKVDVPAQQLYNAIINSPPGFSQGEVAITVNLATGPHTLDITVGHN
jgi:hypothetical protein